MARVAASCSIVAVESLSNVVVDCEYGMATHQGYGICKAALLDGTAVNMRNVFEACVCAFEI